MNTSGVWSKTTPKLTIRYCQQFYVIPRPHCYKLIVLQIVDVRGKKRFYSERIGNWIGHDCLLLAPTAAVNIVHFALLNSRR